MKRIILLLTIALVFSSAVSLNCTYVSQFVENLTYAANNDYVDFDFALNSLNESAKAYGCSGKGILVILSNEKYSYSINDTQIGKFSKFILLEPAGTYNISFSNGSLWSSSIITISSGEFKIIKPKLEANDKSTGGSGGGSLQMISKSTLIGFLEKYGNKIGLNSSIIDDQKAIYKFVPFELNYFVYHYEDASSVYYFIKNDWNQTVNLTVYLVVDKSVSNDLNGLAISNGYKIIESDPIVAWDLTLKPGERAKFGFTVMKKDVYVQPIVLVFHNVKLQEEKSSNLTSSNLTNETNETEMVENRTVNSTRNQTMQINEIQRPNLIYVLMAGVVAIVVPIALFRKDPYSEVEMALDKIDKVLKTRRRK